MENRLQRSLPFSILFALPAAALLAVHMADQWDDDAWLLYGMIALSAIAISVVIFVNASRKKQSETA